MIPFSSHEIAALVQEDLPHLDLTTHTLGIGDVDGVMTFRCRQPTVVAGTEVAAQVVAYCGAQVRHLLPSGRAAAPGEPLLVAEGKAAALHGAWKTAANVLEYAGGIASRAQRLVENAQAARPGTAVVSTRKHFPGIRRLAIMAATAGGVMPHRLGLSETVLVFRQHLDLLGGLPVFLQRLPSSRRRLPSTKIVVEVERSENSLRDALMLAEAGVDGIQFDKLRPDGLRGIVAELRAVAPGVTLFAAGGIDEDNIAAYAATGVDAIVTSAVYHAPPADIGVDIRPLSTGGQP